MSGRQIVGIAGELTDLTEIDRWKSLQKQETSDWLTPKSYHFLTFSLERSNCIRVSLICQAKWPQGRHLA